MYKNILWDLFGKFGGQIVYFGISIILTRLLSPQQYGILGMATVIITFAHIFLDLGFNRAIIQRNETSPAQLSTIFWLNTGIAAALMLICFFLAAPLATFYGQPLIKPVFRVLSLSFLLNGLSLVPSTLLYKRLEFRVNSIITIVATIISGIIGITMAYLGYGVWSLVIQSLVSTGVSLVATVAYIKWHPRFIFDLVSIKPMWRYGSRMFASGVLDSLYTRLDTFIIGKIFSPSTLGYYARAQSMDNMVRQFSANSIMGALFPYIAKHQLDRQYLKEIFIRSLHIILFVSIGISGVLFLTARQIFTILFTAHWEYSAELFQIMSIAGFGWPISSLMCNIISGVGNSSAFFRLEVYKKLLILPVYLFGFFWGLKGFVVCFISVGFIGVALNGIYAGREIYFGFAKQLKIILSYFILAGVCAAVAWAMSYLFLKDNHSQITSLIIIGTLFSFLYLSGSYVFKLRGVEIVNISLDKIKLFFHDKRHKNVLAEF